MIRQVIALCHQICGCDNKREMDGILWVKMKRDRCTFQATPEGQPTLIDHVAREYREKIRYIVRVEFIELETSPFDTKIKIYIFRIECLVNICQYFLLSVRLCYQFRNKVGLSMIAPNVFKKRQ